MRRALILLLILALLWLGWEALLIVFEIPAWMLPTPRGVAEEAVRSWRVLGSQAAFTLSAAVLGLAAALAFAAFFSVVFALSRLAERAAMPALIIARSAPAAAIAPLIMLFTGRGIATSIVVVVLVGFFPLLVNLLRGYAAADRNAIELMHVHGASPLRTLVTVRLPYALPFLFSGLRVASAAALLGAMLSEWITGSDGLGQLILDAAELRELELLWAAVLLSVAMALLAFGATTLAEARATRWRQASAAPGL